MMDKALYDNFVDILNNELRPALGCTEPIAIAFAAASARRYIDGTPTRVEVACSGNIIKNVYGVTVPNSGGLSGIQVAALLGAVGGNAERGLECLCEVSRDDIELTKKLLADGVCCCSLARNVDNLYIDVTLHTESHTAEVEITGAHTNITKVVRDGETLLQKQNDALSGIDKSALNVKSIIDFANCVDISDVRDVLGRQIACNTAISEEGLRGDYGISVGKQLMNRAEPDAKVRARAAAAAGSDARMSGCPLPVVINSGSGNQGMTVSLPVIVYAKELGCGEDKLYRALALANLCALLQKRYIGDLSAFCGAVSAATGAAAGVCYLRGGDYDAISRTITNSLASVSGMVCDGAKPSCALKISVALEAALSGMELAADTNKAFSFGQGLVGRDVEATIANIGRMGKQGMSSTDVEILNIMLAQQNNCK